MTLGLDFDNTIVDYDDLFHRCAMERGLISADVTPVKREVRDAIRRNFDNEQWISLQALVYGKRMREAPATPGLWEFLERCRDEGMKVAVISHKTQRPAGDPSLDLHVAAADWLRAHDLVGRYDVPPDRWYFEITLKAKLERIAREGCRHFVDDLREVFDEPGFPPGVDRMLYEPHGDGALPAGVVRFRSWTEIGDHLFP